MNAPHRFVCFSLLLWMLSACSNSGSDTKESAKKSERKAELDKGVAPPPEGTKPAGDLGYGDDARLFANASLAIAHIIKSHPQGVPRVLGFGEFHKLKSSAPVRSALRQFAGGMIDLIGPATSDLVLESWTIDPHCGRTADVVKKQVEKTIERPPETENEMAVLVRKIKALGIRGHALEFQCDEYKRLLVDGKLDHAKVLTAVSSKLGTSAKGLLDSADKSKMIVIYGGATHNNISPYEGLESWSYAPEIAKITNNGFIEIDLYVPELVEGDELLETEAWYPLLKEARKDQVILIRRESHSYILLLRKGFAE
ncbi:MAG: hypothetical protein JKY56_19785 [Kofleriaceae bacterium]|nr:hypothetical protein [Kofleriaceae bacterium]